jgi:hypothetical protein
MKLIHQPDGNERFVLPERIWVHESLAEGFCLPLHPLYPRREPGPCFENPERQLLNEKYIKLLLFNSRAYGLDTAHYFHNVHHMS